MSRGRRSQVVLHEGDEPDSIAHLLDAYVLAGEDQTQVDLAFAEANAAAMGDSDRAVVKWVLELVQTSIGAVGRSPRVRIVVASIESMNLGAMMRGRGGPIRKGIQGSSGGAVAAAGERDAG